MNNNFFTYVINLRDQMTGKLSGVSKSVTETTKKVQTLQDSVKKLNNTPLTGLKNSFSGLFQSIPFAQYIFNPLTIAGVVGGRALKLGIDQEMRNASFEVLFGGEEKARKMIDNISAYAKQTSYGKDNLSAAVQMMAGFGIAQERIMPNLEAIGEIAMGDKNKLNSLALAFSQMSATGQLMGQDLNQMINAGFNPLLQMSKDTGKSVGELKEAMGKGAISADMVAEAFQNATKAGGQFYGMSKRMGKEVGGLASLGLSLLNDKLIQLYNWMKPYILPIMQSFVLILSDAGSFVDKLVGKLERWYNQNRFLGSIIIFVTTALATYSVIMGVVTVATKAWAIAQGILNVILALNPVGLIIAGIVALIALIAFLIIKIDGWGETWDNVLKMCRLGFESFKTAVTLIWLQVQDDFLKGFEEIEKGWYKVQSLWNEDSANAGLSKLEGERNQRAKEIAKTQGKLNDLSKQMSSLEVFKLRANDTTFSDITKNLKSSLGISSAGIPGIPGDGSVATGGSTTGGATGGGSASGKVANNITTGGSKTTHITLTIGEMGNNMTVNANGTNEAVQKIGDAILDQIIRAAGMAQASI